MSAEERVAVKTYVPEYQKEIWVDHADELDMSQSEFVRTMVQSGRTAFDVPRLETTVSNPDPGDGAATNDRSVESANGSGGAPGEASADGGAITSTGSSPALPSDSHRASFEDRVLEALQRAGPLDWDALVDALIDDVEGELDAALEGLQEANRVRYSGRDGGYVVIHE